MIFGLPLAWQSASLFGDRLDNNQSAFGPQGYADALKHSSRFREVVVGERDEDRINTAGWQQWIIWFAKARLNVLDPIRTHLGPNLFERLVIYVNANDLA